MSPTSSSSETWRHTTRITEMNTAPPLKGDGTGTYRIQIVGNSGTGKSTLADELGDILGLPVIHLDRVYWKPNWVKSSREEFRSRLRNLLDGYKTGWVVDGNYSRRLHGEVDGVTDIIWLDPPFLLYFPRLLKRTLLRLSGFVAPCSPGCGETIRSVFFSNDSILWWAITNHLPLKRRENERLRTQGLHAGGKMRRLAGWGSELDAWKTAVQGFIKKD